MQRIQQPTDTTCGQTCVAMIVDRTVDEVCELMGKKGKTRSKDLVKVLQHFKFDCSPSIRVNQQTKFPPLAILKLRHPTDKTWSHWVVRKDGNDYDPSSEVCALAYGWKLTSFIEVRSHG